jgi:hypothetical protein
MLRCAVLVPFTGGPEGPQVLLTERATDLGAYPGSVIGNVAALDQSEPVTIYRQYAKLLGLGFDVKSIDKARFPAYETGMMTTLSYQS